MGPLLAALPAALLAGSALEGTLAAAAITSVIEGVELAALGMIAQSLIGKPNPNRNATSASKLDFGQDPLEARSWCYGTGATAGTAKYWETTDYTGDDNLYLWFVVAIHDTPVYQIRQFYMAQEKCQFSGTLDGFHVTGGATTQPYVQLSNPYMWVYPHKGADDRSVSLTAQAPDAALSAVSTLWGDGKHFLKGVAYYVWKLQWNQAVYGSGRPQPLVALQGRYLYDPRNDPAYGGSTLPVQSATDEKTWAWSNLAPLALLDYLRGIYLNGVKIGGCGLSIDMIDIPSFQHAANVADDSISRIDWWPTDDTIPVPGSVPRYTIDGFVSSLEDKKTVVAAMLDAMAGVLTVKNGKVSLFVGEATVATITLTDDDLAGELQVNPSRSTQDKHNGVTATFYDYLADQGMRETPPLTNATYVAEDGGLDLEVALVHRFTNTNTIAQRLNKIFLMNEREQLTTDAVWKPKARNLALWDTYYWTSAATGYTAQKMRVTGRHLNTDGTIRLQSRQETDAKWNWVPATDEQQYDVALDVQASWYDTTKPGSASNPFSGAEELGATSFTATMARTTLAISASDKYVDVTNSSGVPITLTMPPVPRPNAMVTITDMSGNAGLLPITVKDSTGVTTLATVRVNLGFARLRWNGTRWIVN